MGLTEIVAAIGQEADAEVAAIEARADQEATRLLETARARADREREDLARSRDEAAVEASARIVNRARLEADRAVRAAREELFEEALRRLRERLAVARADPGYGAVLERFFAEARALVTGGALVRVDPADVEVMRHLVARRRDHVRVEGSLRSWGGLELLAYDGRAVVNTLEARLGYAEHHLRRLAVELIPELGRVAS